MNYMMARNIDKVLDVMVKSNQVKVRVGTFLDSMWDAAVNDKHGPQWPNERGVGEVGVVFVTANDVREFAMSQVGAAKQVIELAIKNPKYTLSQLAEIIDGATGDFQAADYVMTSLEGYASNELFAIYSNPVDLP